MVAIGKEFNPDLILHTGDLFDVSHPAVDDMRLGIEMLDELASIAPVVVLCGNHDSPKLFNLFSILRRGERVHFVDKARPPADGGILEFPTATGERIRLAPLPFVRHTSFVSEFGDPADWSSVYADDLAKVETILGEGLRDGADLTHDVLIFAAHLHVTGAILAHSERPVHIDDFATRVESIPPVSYAAFGHIHKPQQLPGRNWARYAGSPIPLDFGEIDEQKSIVLVEARPSAAARVDPVPISGGRPLKRVTGTLDDLAARASDLRGALAIVLVKTDSATTMLYEQVKEILPDTVLLQVEPEHSRSAVAAVETTEDATESSLSDLFQAFLNEQGARDVDNVRVLDTFNALVRASAADEPLTLPELESLQEAGS
jgi:exonuclease SbcD